MRRTNFFKSTTVVILLVGASMTLSSCATIFSGSRQQVTFTSYPPGATVVDRRGETLGVTPTVANVRRASNPRITMQLGDQVQDVNLSGSFNPNVLWNILLGGIPGMLIDYSTGAAWRYNNPNAFVQFPSSTAVARTPAQVVQPVDLTRTSLGAGQRIAVIDPVGSVAMSTIEIVREEISTVIVNYTDFTVLERALINQVLQEDQFQASGLVDDAQISEAGRRMGANYVLVTSLTLMADRNYHISARKIDVVTARVAMQRTARTTQGGGELMDVVQAMMGLMFLQGN